MAERNSQIRKSLELNGVVAERILYFAGEPKRHVKVTLGRPVSLIAKRTVFQCSFSILGDGIEHYFTAEGVDSMQAVVMALEMIAVELAIYNRDHDVKLRFFDDANPDLGFPLGLVLKTTVRPS